MPARILSNLLDRVPAAPAAKLQNGLTSISPTNSVLSLSSEKEKTPKVKAKEKKEKKEKGATRHDSFSMDAFKRHSLAPGRRHSGEHKRGKSPKPKAEEELPAKIDVEIESPPMLFIGPPTDPNGENSTGALFSCQLQLNVMVPSIHVVRYETRLVCLVKHTHPVEKHCPDCITKETELKTWEHITEPRTYKKGEYSKPLQYLFPGHLPATTHGASLATVEYRLVTKAVTSSNEEIKHDIELSIRRAIPPGAEKHSVRIFPPTNLTVNCALQPIVHPIGEIPIGMRMEGILDVSKKDTLLRWRLRKLNWKIEETHKMISPACSKHADKVGGVGKGVKHEDVKTIGHGEVKDGWKTDFDDGKIECEFKAAVNPNLRPTCDVEAPNGLSITHALILELVVAEEWAPKNRPNQMTPTGAARILRTQFNLILTERMGMGIAWDQEMPPMYEDVPPSPPLYNTGEVGELDSESLRELDLTVPREPSRPSSAAGPVTQPQRGAFSAEDFEIETGPSAPRNGRDEEEDREPSPDVQAGSTS